MKTTKRILAGVLMVCMLLSMMIPAAFAADPTVTANNGVLEYLFGFSDGDTSRKQNADAVKERVFATADQEGNTTLTSSYLSTSRPDRGYDCSASHIQFRAGASDVWYAIKIKVSAAGTYNATFTVGAATAGGVSNVFVVDSDKYLDALNQTPASDTENYTTIAAKLAAAQKLTSDDNKKIYDYLNTTSVGSVDSYTDAASEQNIGSVSFPEAGEYVCLFVSSKKSDLNTEGNASAQQLALKKLTLTPVVKNYEVTTGDELKSVLSAAESNSTVVLLNDVTVEETLTVSENVTLDLNGKELKADSVTAIAAGAKVIDSVGSGTLVVAEKNFSGNGNNGGYLPLYNGTSYSFYQADVNVNSATDGKLKFQVKFDKDAGYDALSQANTGVDIGGYFGWTVKGGEAQKQSWGITYENATLAQTWGKMVKEKEYANGWIVLSFSGLDQFDALSVAPYIESDTGVRIQTAAQTLK